jgi:hypothetical protein
MLALYPMAREGFDTVRAGGPAPANLTNQVPTWPMATPAAAGVQPQQLIVTREVVVEVTAVPPTAAVPVIVIVTATPAATAVPVEAPADQATTSAEATGYAPEFLADCAAGQAAGRRVSPRCPANAAALLGGGR